MDGTESILRESFARTDSSGRSAAWFVDRVPTVGSCPPDMDLHHVARDLANELAALKTTFGVRYLAVSFVESLGQHFVNACTRQEFISYVRQSVPTSAAAWYDELGDLFDSCRRNDITIVALGNPSTEGPAARAAWWSKVITVFVPPIQAYIGYTHGDECDVDAIPLVGPAGGFDMHSAAGRLGTERHVLSTR